MNTELFNALYARDRNFVRGLVRRFGVAERDVDDMTQEVFLDVARGAYDPEQPFRPWVYTIVQRKVRDHRELARHREKPAEVEALAPAASPEEAVAGAQAVRMLSRALAQLPETMRKVLVMADVDEEPQGEIRASLALSEPAMQSLLRRSRRDLGRIVRLADRGVALLG